MDKKKFSLKKVLLIVIPIALIVILIAWKMGSKVIRGSKDNSKTKAEITMLIAAISQYYDRYGHLPKQTSGEIDFAEQLSSTPVNSGQESKRDMYIDFYKNYIKVTNSNYADANANPTKVLDPWGTAYQFIPKTSKEFEVFSAGADKNAGTDDDIRISR
ncbi:MAG: type II secretion system protein GspG [Lentisphaeraceae bacterium]|nr:type II secretion system protein GspG [Lentisphaeraceae bacterium]